MNKAIKASGVTASTLTFGMIANFDDVINANALDLKFSNDHPIGCTCALCQYGPTSYKISDDNHEVDCTCDACIDT